MNHAIGLAAVSTGRYAILVNWFVTVLLVGIFVLLVVLFGYHIAVDIRSRRRAVLRKRVRDAIGRFITAPDAEHAAKIVIPGKDVLFTRQGVAVLSQVFDEVDDMCKSALRSILLRMGFAGFVNKQLKTDNEDYLVEVVRLIGDLDLVGLDSRIAALLYSHKDNIDVQYQAFHTLSRLGSADPIVRVCMDENYVQTLSFRSLQQILVCFTGDRQDLYSRLLASPDHYVTRICIKRIGIEQMLDLAPMVEPFLDSEDYNLIIDAIRTLGALRYQPAAGKAVGFLKHERWEVRGVAVTALAAIDRDAYEDELIRALQDSEWQVRYNAGLALRTSPNIAAIHRKVEATGDRFALDMLEYMMQTVTIWRQAQ